MQKELRFKAKPTLDNLNGLTINGSEFEIGKGFLDSEIIVMEIPDTFRFKTKLEAVKDDVTGDYFLVMTQFLTRGVDYWEMEQAFDRIGFRNPEIEVQLRDLCEKLISHGLAEWVYQKQQ